MHKEESRLEANKGWGRGKENVEWLLNDHRACLEGESSKRILNKREKRHEWNLSSFWKVSQLLNIVGNTSLKNVRFEC